MKLAIRQFLACAVVGWCALQARAEESLNPLLPYDTLAFAELNPAASPAHGNDSGLLDLGVQAMQSMGLLSRQASEAGDILSLASIAGSRHSCVALLDADLAATANNDLECRSVQIVWLIDDGGQPRGMIDRLTGVLSHLSTRATAKQAVKRTAEEKREYVEFHDSTWPAWLTLDWTQRGNLFVLAIGSGAMEHYLADRPVGGAPWISTMAAIDKQAEREGSTGSMLARVYVTPQGFRERFPEAMSRTLLGRLFGTLDLANADAALFSARSQGRQISMDSGVVTNGSIAVTPWTVPPAKVDPAIVKAVPAGATAYLVLQVHWEQLYDRALALADAMIPGESDSLETMISRFAQKRQVNVHRDILAHLQPLVLVHNWPPHPLRLPLMVTAVAAARPEDEELVRTNLRTLLDAATGVLDRRARRKGGPPLPADADFTHLRLRTNGDGVSYLQLGVVGPAWAWVQNRFVFSWSPAAVRDNLPGLSAIPAEAFSPASAGR